MKLENNRIYDYGYLILQFWSMFSSIVDTIKALNTIFVGERHSREYNWSLRV